MGSLFSLDTPIWNFMSKVADLIILNLLAFICSIPIFTIGASWTALYFVTIRMVRKEEGYIIKDFFRSFRENFKQATRIWLMILLVFGILVGDFLICRMMPEQIPQFIKVVICAVGYLVMGTVIYIFPLLARYDNSIKNTLKNAFILSVVKFPYTLISIILIVLPIITAAFIMEIIPIVIVIGISLPAYLISMMLVRIFRIFEPEEAVLENEEETEEG